MGLWGVLAIHKSLMLPASMLAYVSL